MDAIDLIIKANTLASSKLGTCGDSKEKRYKWKITDNPGTFMMINKNDLYIDHTYQRDRIKWERVNSIASNFSWAAFGTIGVSMREGKWRVFDGQHRVLAAMKMDSVKDIPCMVFESSTQKEESKTFLSANSNRAAVNAYTKFKAGLVSEDPVCLSVKSAADSLGYNISEHACKPLDIGCVWALMQSEGTWSGSVYEILNALKPLASENVISSTLVRALQVIRVNIPDGLKNKTFISRLSSTSLQVIEKYMKDEALMIGKGTNSVWARGLLKAINAGHRQKIKMEKYEERE